MRNRKIWAAMLIALLTITAAGCKKQPGSLVDNNTSEITTTEADDRETEESGEGVTEPSSEDVTEKDTTSSNEDGNADKETTTYQGDEEETLPSDEGNENETTSEVDIESPTTKPTEIPTNKPVDKPTEKPTEAPTIKPTEAPTAKPTQAPTVKPTQAPTVKPTEAPTAKPTEAPTAKPTEAPTTKPTQAPTQAPTAAPGGRVPYVVNKAISTYPEIQQGYSNVTEADILKVRSIISSIIYTDMSTIEKVKTVHDYLVKSTTYDTAYYSKDGSHNHLSNILNENRAVCQGYAVAFYVFMNELDIPCSLVSGYAGEAHAWNAVKMGNEWYMIDVTWGDPIVQGTSNYPNGDNLTYTYFLCTKTFMDASHTPNEYVGLTPDVYGTSLEYNNYPYYQMGYKGIYRIYTLDDLDCVSNMTQSGDYMFFKNSDQVDIQTIMDKINEFLYVPGMRWTLRYGSTSVIVTIIDYPL